MNNFYQLLVFFQKGEQLRRDFLLKHCTPELIQQALDNRFITESTNNDGDVVYSITRSGIEERDKLT
ncbi:MAG: hypothetical protein IKN55_01320 [Oscillospiraceae bacterium]|nr:hypothetical protein [Oscillospiraceae bacterium]